MKHYDFETPVNRRGTNSYKWDMPGTEDVLPMWVADMDFRTAPCIIDALKRRVEHGVFGYTRVPGRYFEEVVRWFGERHGWRFNTDEIIYTTGVVPALSAVIKALTAPGDKVIVQTPVYNCFFSSIRNNNCELLENPLRYEDGKYSIDFDDLERKTLDPRARLLLLCNPHNPAGRVWTAEELKRINDVCLRHGIKVIADEIHCELVMPGFRYVPFASVSSECASNSVTCNSPSKAFNTAGLQIANIISNNADVRARIDRAININEVCDVNPFGVEALMAAYTDQGAEWLAELVDYIHANYVTLRDYFARNLPELRVTELEGTYLVWVDCRSLGLPSSEIGERLVHTRKLWLNTGDMYGSEGFMRINIACPRAVMLEGLRRLRDFVRELGH